MFVRSQDTILDPVIFHLNFFLILFILSILLNFL